MTELSTYVSALYAAFVAGLLGYAAWRDLLSRTIPDQVSIALLGAGLVARATQGWSALGVSITAALVVFVLLLPLCARHLLGGADLKLLAALTAGLAPAAVLHLFLAVSVLGGVLAATYLLAGRILGAGTRTRRHRRPSSLAGRILAVEFWRIRRRAPLPYGVAIAFGTAVIMLRHQGV